MSSVIHVVCGTELFPLLPMEADRDDHEKFKRKSSLFDILRTIAAALRDESTSASLQFGPNFVSLGRILNLDPSKGEQRDAEEFIDKLFDYFIELAPSGIFSGHFRSRYVNFTNCLRCMSTRGYSHHSKVYGVTVPYCRKPIAFQSLLWDSFYDRRE